MNLFLNKISFKSQITFQDIESSRSYIDELYATDHHKCLDAIMLVLNLNQNQSQLTFL